MNMQTIVKAVFTISSISLLAACQVTGEKNNLYQSALGNFGSKVEHIPLVATDNSFDIIVPNSGINSRRFIRGLVGTRDIVGFSDINNSFNHFYTSSYRQLYDTRSKLKLCHAIQAQHRD